MKAPSLQKTAALSAALHATLFLISIIALRNSGRMTMPSPYIVDLVSPGEVASVPAGRTESAQETAPAAETARAVEKAPVVSRADEHRLEDRLHALEALRKLERNARIRKEILSIKAAGSGKTNPMRTSGRQGARGIGGGGEMTYADKIRSTIHDNWHVDDRSFKNLETIVSIRILKSGEIQVLDVEKKSGNRYFDSQALGAIVSSSPAPPPPHEMEFGIRFTP